jgi:hypothetical protein
MMPPEKKGESHVYRYYYYYAPTFPRDLRQPKKAHASDPLGLEDTSNPDVAAPVASTQRRSIHSPDTLVETFVPETTTLYENFK